MFALVLKVGTVGGEPPVAVLEPVGFVAPRKSILRRKLDEALAEMDVTLAWWYMRHADGVFDSDDEMKAREAGFPEPTKWTVIWRHVEP